MKTFIAIFLSILTIFTTLSATEKSNLTKEPEKNRAIKRNQGRAVGIHKKIIARVKKGDSDLIMLGDSITECFCWKPRGLPVWETHYGSYNPINMGISGDRAEHLLWRIQDGTLEGLNPKVAVLMIGANNISGEPIDTALTIKQIIKEIRIRLPKTKILMLEILPVGKKPMDDKHHLHHKKINSLIRHYSDDKWVFTLDMSQTFLDPKGNLRMELMQDSWHPNKQGYQAWAEAMAPSLKELIKE